MSMALRIMIFRCAALVLAGCGRSASYRYKLALTLNTLDGVKTGSNVVEINAFDVILPARGIGHKTTGQALYVDLGAGRRPLIALLTRIRRATDPWPTFRGWGEDAPGEALADKCLGAKKPKDWLNEVEATRKCGRPVAITPADLPDLVTFADTNDPKSAMLVDPNDLNATLGPGVSWRSMTLEATDEPLSKGVDEHLSWMRGYDPNIEIRGVMPFNPLKNYINGRDFIREK
jgi:hypothetical protein